MKHLFLSAVLLGSAQAASTTEFDTAARAFLENEVAAWAADPVLIGAIRAQNESTAGYAADQIEALDQSWRAQVGQPSPDLIDPVLHNQAADFLRAQASASNGRITEILLMDAVGLNVAVSHVTSDYWQGDEEKHNQTYAIGPGAVHIGEIEFDESSQSYQAQLSLTITDPQTGEALGALTVGVLAESLM
jgi:hypothetical protein